jgi:hypothetical protein
VMDALADVIYRTSAASGAGGKGVSRDP